MEWKVGDEFIIIDAEEDHLPSTINGKVCKIISLTRPERGNASNKGVVWFEFSEWGTHGNIPYIQKKNIRPLTKLDRILK